MRRTFFQNNSPKMKFFVGYARYFLRGGNIMPNTNNSKQHSPESLAADSHIPEILPPTDDWVFKLLFGDKRNESILIDLLKSFVELPDEEFELIFLDTHLKPEFKDDKLGIVDVKVKTKTGKIINIEVQVKPKKDIWRRISFYKSKLLVEQISEGENYETIEKVICICIADHVLFPKTQKYLHRFRYTDIEDNLVLEEIPEEIYIAEIPRAPARDDGSGIWSWLQFFRAQSREEFEMIAKLNAEIRNAVDALYVLSSSKRRRARYEARLKYRRDHKAEVDWAYDDGMEKGLEKGREEIARNALAEGLPIHIVQKITGLDEETIKNLGT